MFNFIRFEVRILTPVLSSFVKETSRSGYATYGSVNLGPTPSKCGFDHYENGRREGDAIKVPERFNFSRDVVDFWADEEQKGKRCNSIPAYWYIHSNGNELKWSFKELSTFSKRAANILEACEIKKGDILLVTLPKIPEWWLLYLATIRIGAIFCSGTSMLKAGDIKYRLGASKANCVVCNKDTFPAVSKGIKSTDEIIKVFIGNMFECRPDWIDFNDLLYRSAHDDEHKCVDSYSNENMTYFFTSGTTGKPKIVKHTHAYGFSHQITAKYWLDCAKDDIVFSLADPGWAKAAYSNFFAPWYNGSCVFIDETAKFCPGRILNILQHYPISVFCASPTAYRMMVQTNVESYTFRHLRHCLSAGEALNPGVFKIWYEKTGLVLREGFGQTETIIQSGMFQCLPIKPGSMGKAIPGMSLQIIDKQGKEVERGTEGDIAIQVKPKRPIGMFVQYSDEERTSAAFQGDFYKTGDRGTMDEDGYLWFVSRSDDVIISSGYRIGPFEVESVLIEHPAVVEAAAVSSPHEERGQIVAAYIVLHEDYEDFGNDRLKETLQEFVKQKTAPYKYPRKIVFVKELPKTVSGKIQRVKLKQKEWEQFLEE